MTFPIHYFVRPSSTPFNDAAWVKRSQYETDLEAYM